MAKPLNKADLSGLSGAALEEAALGNWVTLNKVLRQLNRDQVVWLLVRELSRDLPRPLFVKRIHQRLATLRQRDEVAELEAFIKSPPYNELGRILPTWLNEESQ